MSISMQDVVENNGDGSPPSNLKDVLEKIVALQQEKERIASAAKSNNASLDVLEKLAVEMMAASGLDGVRAAGKSWYLREFFSVSVPSENRQQVVEAAKAEGLGDELVTVNTTTLKSWLVERRGSGSDTNSNGSLAEGTSFDGLIREFREVRLSHRSVG
jgi:hypothetical protein